MPKIKITEIAVLQEKMAEIDQFSPLFDDAPEEEMFTNISGDVVEFKLGERVLKSLELKNGGKTVRVPLVQGTEGKSAWNIGLFTALRDYTSQSGNEFVAGQTQRVFAY